MLPVRLPSALEIQHVVSSTPVLVDPQNNFAVTSGYPVEVEDVLAFGHLSPGYLSLPLLVEGCDGFAGVHSEHKSQIVRLLKNRGWLTGMTGDGVYVAPVLNKADVGIASK